MGIENWQLGVGQINAALVRQDLNALAVNYPAASEALQVNTNTLDVRYNNIPLWDNATLALLARYSVANKSDTYKNREDNGSYYSIKDSWLAGVVVRQALSAGGFEEFTVQAADNSLASGFAPPFGPSPT